MTPGAKSYSNAQVSPDKRIGRRQTKPARNPPNYEINQFARAHVLKKHRQSLAMLHAILSSDWVYRHFSLDAHWSKGEVLGSMRKGQGSALRCLFTELGAVHSGFDIEQKKTTFVLKPSDLPASHSAFCERTRV